jgi:hypothetical protein
MPPKKAEPICKKEITVGHGPEARFSDIPVPLIAPKHVRNALFPYFALGFMSVHTSG